MAERRSTGVSGAGIARIAGAGALLAVFLVIVFPVAWLVLTAFKLPRDVYEITWLFQPTAENFAIIFQPPWNLGRRIANSVIVAAATVAIAIPVATLAAYSFSRFDFFMKRGLFYLILATQFVPAVVIMRSNPVSR